MFGRHSGTGVEDRPVNDAPVDDRTGAIKNGVAVDEDRDTERMQARPGLAAEGRAETVDDAGPGVVEGHRSVAGPTTVDEPVDGTSRQRWAHVSLTATLSLIAGTVAVAATLTGLLAPLGFAVGVIAVILALTSVSGVGRSHVTGHGIVMTGLLFGAFAIVLSLLAINGQLPWLSSDTNEITVVHNWLNDHMHWLRRW